MHKYFLLLLVVLATFSSTASAQLKIYYIRHAEGGHNVKKAWEEKSIPKSEWPAYVGNPDMFTPKGKREVEEATKKLQDYKFDFIATSPAWRARHTILPYLELTGQKAEVWPELREGTGMTMILAKGLPQVKEPILNLGDEIEIPSEEGASFVKRPDATRNYKRYPRGSDEPARTAYMKYVTKHAIQLIEARFGGSKQSILLAGHNSAGVSLLKLLLGEAPGGDARRGQDNIGIWMVEQQDDGSYELKIYNSRPFSTKN